MASKTTLQVRSSLRQGLSIAASAFITLWLASLVFGLGIIALPEYNTLFLGSLAAPGPADAPLPSLLIEAVRRRLEYFGGWFTLLTLLTLTLGLILLLTSRLHRKTDDNVSKSKSDDSAEFSSSVTAGPNSFVLLLILFGTLLVLGPEFFFLRDQFGWRINTIFKFYYQAWLFWSIAAAVSVTIMLTAARHPLNTSRILSVAFRVLLLAVLIVGLAYPVFSLWNKTNGFQSPENWTLDGAAYFAQQSPDEMAAVAWLQKAAPGIIAEAVSPTGGSYTDFARMSKFSGQPAVLGWMGHESQWRGGGFEMGSRQSDLERLYCSKDWEETQVILKRYQIRYVYIGSLERATYTPKGTSCPSGLVEAKFKRFLLPVFEQGQAIIYEVPR